MTSSKLSIDDVRRIVFGDSYQELITEFENMPKATVVPSTLKADTYEAEYVECKEMPIPDKKDPTEQTIVFKHFWKVTDKSSGQIVDMNELSDTKITSGNKAGAIVSALLNRPVKIGESIEFDDLKGKKCKLVIKPKTTDRGTFSSITDHLPL